MAAVQKPLMQASLRLKRNDSDVEAAVASPRPRSTAVVLSKTPPPGNNSNPSAQQRNAKPVQTARVIVTPGASQEPKIWTATGMATSVSATPPPPSPKRISVVRMNTVGTTPSTTPSSPVTTPLHAGRSPTIIRKSVETNKSPLIAPRSAILVRRESGEKRTINPPSPRSPRARTTSVNEVQSPKVVRKEPERKPIASTPQKAHGGMVEIDVTSGRKAEDETKPVEIDGKPVERASVISLEHKHNSARIVRVESKRHAPPTGATASPFLHSVLAQVSKSPFDKPVFGRMNPRELSFCLEDAYCPLPEILKAMMVKLSQEDVVVCSPLRTGQTPLLRGLMMLLSDSGTLPSDQALLEHVGFLGSTLPHVPLKNLETASKFQRLFKTHINLRCFVRSEAPSRTSPKIIILLRDPLCVIESWFRHMTAVYAATMKKNNFPFGQADFRLFCPGTYSAAKYQEGEDYAKFVSTAISVMHLPNVKLVFYEDLVADPSTVFRELSEFLGVEYSDAVGKAIAKNAREQEFKLQPVFSEEFLFAREELWKDHISYGRTALRPQTYYELYETVTGRTFPAEKFASQQAMLLNATTGSKQQ